MNNSRAALRYAKAVLNFALDKKAAKAVEKDMRNISTTVSDSEQLRDLLASPILKAEVKKKALSAIFTDTHAITQGLVNLLIGNKRISMLQEVAFKYIILNEQLKGQDVAYVTTAVPLTPALETKVLQQVAQLTGNEVSLENKIDESIIGGFVLRVGDLQFDSSIANQLNNLKREFSKSSI
ncbi:ATP synthase F1 subunit delta [Flavobacteriaceae bacterium F89]|uniref:ATP synthase subunit delta n=1 Tax=Cerina litoralis TaxID=2874477 RepID=A0AAE3JNG7_9FLAO|nr:ATP synthase F1 subunit delta [Cerina litoralis]MCG2460935.1 ATP synthase F1 subunit delta [Cerina litoralis]